MQTVQQIAWGAVLTSDALLGKIGRAPHQNFMARTSCSSAFLAFGCGCAIVRGYS